MCTSKNVLLYLYVLSIYSDFMCSFVANFEKWQTKCNVKKTMFARIETDKYGKMR